MIKKWEQAVRKSILVSGLGIVLVGIVLPIEFFAAIFIVHPMFVIPFFFIISVLGWFFVGIPCHWLINRYTNGNSLYYVSASMVVLLVFVLLIRNRLGVVLGVLAVVQCLIFVYYLKRKGTIKIP